MKKLFTFLIISVAALTLNAQVYTEYFTTKFDGSEFLPGDPIETGDALEENFDGWYLSAKATNREVGPDGQASPLVTSEDALFYGDYKGSEKGQVVKLDSAVAYDSDQRSSFWAVANADGDTLKMPASGAVYTAFLYQPLANSKNSVRDFFGYEFSATNNTSRGRVFVALYNQTDVQFGVSRNKTKVSDGLDTAMTYMSGVDMTYLLVMKYEIGDPAVDQDDTVRLYINPDPMLPEAEQTGTVIRGTDAQDDRKEGDVIRLRIRQRGMNGHIGGIRVGTDWKEVLQGLAATGVTLDQETLDLDVGATGVLVATVSPEDAADKTVSWSSSDEAVATVNDGVVEGIAGGTATITATTNDGGLTADCAVTVTAPDGVNDIGAEGLNIYPNPSNGSFSISGNVNSVAIYNVTGTLVYELNSVENNQLINTDLAKGMYFVVLSSNDAQQVSKLIIE